MKKNIILILSMVLAVSLSACTIQDNTSTSAQIEENRIEDTTESDILIAYFSMPEDVDTSGVDEVASASIVVEDGEKMGSIQFVAETIQETIGGDLFHIETVEDYPLEHDALVDQAASEQSENLRPELDTNVQNFDQYETILLGFPNWQEDMPMAIYTFLEEYDFGAKTIIPFITHGGNGASDMVNTISEIQPGALIRDNALILSENDVAKSTEDIIRLAEELNLNFTEALPSEGTDTVANATPVPNESQIFYLWEEGNVPTTTEYTVNNGNYADDPDFRPYIVTFPVPEGTEIKGAVLINAGGAFQFRSNQYEGTPVAEELSKLGYQSFVVNYRLTPYTQEEGALDLARAVRFVRTHADEYGIEESDIAVMGFSAGGILAGEMLLNYDGLVNGTALDDTYVPDELDNVSADAAAAGMIYSFYGRLSVASTDVDKFRSSDLPPTYFTYGTRDPFVGEFEECVEALQEAGITVESHELQGMPHGFGNTGGWIPDYDRFLTEVFDANN